MVAADPANVFASAQHGEHTFEMRRKASFSNLSGALRRMTYAEEESETTTSDLVSRQNKLWSLMHKHMGSDIKTIQQGVVNHVEYTLAKNRFNFDEEACYRATAYSIRDRLVENLNDTNSFFFTRDVKRCYYLSLEFLVGRAMQNALVNLDIEENYRKALNDLGYSLETLYEYEKDAALGNGGLGRLAACFLDSMATLDFPCWGYGIRYTYGIFEQKIVDGRQLEFPDYWLVSDNPWEIPRPDVTYAVRFMGEVKEVGDGKGQQKYRWTGGELVQAEAYDNPVPGFDTYNCINMRLWRAAPSREFDFNAFNTGRFLDAIAERQSAESISAILYPNDNTSQGKELRLKQQYFFVCATIQDTLRRFKKRADRDWRDLPMKLTMQLNDTHPTIAIPELMRILIDVEPLDWTLAWELTTNVFNYTNHTVMPEALEKWPAAMLERLLPRHLLIINEINFQFLNEVRLVMGDDGAKIAKMSIYQEGWDKMIRMANLAVIGSRKVNGVAAIHSDLVKRDLFPEFVEFYAKKGVTDKFINITNGVTPRRWIHCANRALSNMISNWLGSDSWLRNLNMCQGLLNNIDDEKFVREWQEVKKKNKIRLAKWVAHNTGVKFDAGTMMFDIQVKRIHEYKRQLLNSFYMLHRYIKIKSMSPDERKQNIQPRASMIGGKAAPGYVVAKSIIKLVNNIAALVNNDVDVSPYLKVAFLPNYKVSAAQIIIPGCDLSQQISTAGTEASGTSNMKFTMNGALTIGTLDGANVEIREECGKETIFLFGVSEDEVGKVRDNAQQGRYPIDPRLLEVFNFIRDGKVSFGDNTTHSEFCGIIQQLVNNGNGINGDFYLVCHDFPDYVRANEEADDLYKNRTNEWFRLSIQASANMGKFTTDRTIADYAANIWRISQTQRPAPKPDSMQPSGTSTPKAQATKGPKAVSETTAESSKTPSMDAIV